MTDTKRKIIWDGQEVKWADIPSCVKGYTCGELYLTLGELFQAVEKDESLPVRLFSVNLRFLTPA